MQTSNSHPNGPGVSRSCQKRLHRLPDAHWSGAGRCSRRAGCMGMGVHGSSSATLKQLIVGGGRVGLLGSVVKGELEAKMDGV